MPFSEDIKIKALVSCGRKCCICHKFCGNNMEIHHIKQKQMGEMILLEMLYHYALIAMQR